MRLVALTETVPLPAGTTTVADVAVALTTCAALPPKETVAFSRPNPPMVTSAPGRRLGGGDRRHLGTRPPPRDRGPEARRRVVAREPKGIRPAYTSG